MNIVSGIWVIFMLWKLPVEGTVKWGYRGDMGPHQWGDRYKLCNGLKQSPIRIVPHLAVHNPFIKRLTVQGYDATSGNVLSMYNNGKSVQVRLSGPAYVYGGGLPGAYTIAQFHFHWGGSHETGSEHVLNNIHYPLEVHLVHYANKYKSLEEAMTKPDGLAVLGTFFQITAEDNPKLNAIISKLPLIQTQGDSVLIKKFNLMSLLPEDSTMYYRYQGSLTTPPCFESVTWTVFHHPINISMQQLNRFKSLMKKPEQQFLNFTGDYPSDLHIIENFRPLQPLNGRIVYSNFVPPANMYSSDLRIKQTPLFIWSIIVIQYFLQRLK